MQTARVNFLETLPTARPALLDSVAPFSVSVANLAALVVMYNRLARITGAAALAQIYGRN